MEEHPIQGLMTTAMENLKDMVEVNTIIGDPVKSPDGSVIIPVSKLGFGFAAGGSEFGNNQESSDQDSNSEYTLPFGGGSGGGVSINPVAFLIVNDDGVKVVHIDEHTHIYEKMLDNLPEVVDKVQHLFHDSNNNKELGRRRDRHDRNDRNDKKERTENHSKYEI